MKLLPKIPAPNMPNLGSVGRVAGFTLAGGAVAAPLVYAGHSAATQGEGIAATSADGLGSASMLASSVLLVTGGLFAIKNPKIAQVGMPLAGVAIGAGYVSTKV